MSANTGWVKQDDVGREAWKFLLCEDKRIYGYVSNYSDAIDMWSWQARQGDYWLCELAPNRDEAMRCAEAALALPLSEFNQLVLKDLLVELSALVKKIEGLTAPAREVSDEQA